MPISVGTHYCVEFFKNNSGPFKMIGVPLLCKVFLVFFHFSNFPFVQIFEVRFFGVFQFVLFFFINNIDPK